MSSSTPSSIADAAERARALDPERSFLIQAPAGSGKTELLIQRFLVLLARVRFPEEIVAVTFTRKAAGEMRHRVLKALEGAAGPEPQSPHARHTWQLARAVIERDRECGWELVRYPGRLRVMTIDSLCAGITRQMPRLAGFGAQPGVAETPEDLYREAARLALESVEREDRHGEAAALLLRHLDTNYTRVEELLVDMLKARDQWLRHVVSGGRSRSGQRKALEGALEAVVRDSLEALHLACPGSCAQTLAFLARFAAANLQAASVAAGENPIVYCAGISAAFPQTPPSVDVWLGLAHLLLTKEGDWRKAFNVKTGFPSPGEAPDERESELRRRAKEQIGELVGSLSGTAEGELFRARLHAVRLLPSTAYPDGQWAILDALLTLLPLAVAQLRLVFQGRGEVDFAEVAMRAVEALGDDDEPTDLGLALDYRIQHMLVDEFQDTSLGQYRLLERLTAGWEAGDGRTLFLVGDPMQSIYRFREAEVGLFLRAAEKGELGQVPLEFLCLRCNFRSDGRVVDWVNGTFEGVLPGAADLVTGAVPYSVSVPARAACTEPRVTVHPMLSEDPAAEARLVADLVSRELRPADGPARKVAVLVRSRSHLAFVLPALREAGLPYRAIDIDPLAGRAAVQDLLALTRALIHPADRIAWLAVLRAPWCGLSAADLHALASADLRRPLWDIVNHELHVAHEERERTELGEAPQQGDLFGGGQLGLSEEGQERLARVGAVLRDALAVRCRVPLRRLVEGAWLALGGPACLPGEADLADAREFLELLDELDDGGDLHSLEQLDGRLSSLFAVPDPQADGSLQVMTIHKSKGLEFEVVILPGLGRKAAADKKRLLLWAELPYLSCAQKLLLAPIEETGQTRDPIYSYIWGIHRDKGAHESGRVLYVACTRAREHLHLIGHAVPKRKDDGAVVLSPPSSNTMLGLLWPAVNSAFLNALQEGTPEASQGAELPEVGLSPDLAPPAADAAGVLYLRRLKARWHPPACPSDAARTAAAAEEVTMSDLRRGLDFETAGTVTRNVGIVLHRCLRLITTDAQRNRVLPEPDQLFARRAAIRTMLAHLGTGAGDLDAATERVVEALRRTLTDTRGIWILNPAHREAAVNVTLSGVCDSIRLNTTIDRTFVDADGTRWIIDYKATVHEGGNLEQFLSAQARHHAPTLRAQAALFASVYGSVEPIRTGVYFPHLGQWREVE